MLQLYPPLHDPGRPVHPVPEDRLELVPETLDDEPGYLGVVVRRGQTHREVSGMHPDRDTTRSSES
jgi:hypothetical protein